MDAEAIAEMRHKGDSSGKLGVTSPECQDGELDAQPQASGELGSSRGGTGSHASFRNVLLAAAWEMGWSGGQEVRSGAEGKGWLWALRGRRRDRWEGQQIRSLKGRDFVGSCRDAHTQTEWSQAERWVPSHALQTPRLTETPVCEMHSSVEMDTQQNQRTGTDLQGAGDTVPPGGRGAPWQCTERQMRCEKSGHLVSCCHHDHHVRRTEGQLTRDVLPLTC